jgi:hypothetical protein
MKIELDKKENILNVLCDCGVRGKITIDAEGNAKIESIAGTKKPQDVEVVKPKKENSFFDNLFSTGDDENES